MLAKLQPWQKTLLDAAEIIKTHGWAAIGRPHPAGSVCAYVAIMRVASVNGVASGNAVRAFVRGIGGHDEEDIFRWNDAPERTKAEVIKALQAAALT